MQRKQIKTFLSPKLKLWEINLVAYTCKLCHPTPFKPQCGINIDRCLKPIVKWHKWLLVIFICSLFLLPVVHCVTFVTEYFCSDSSGNSNALFNIERGSSIRHLFMFAVISTFISSIHYSTLRTVSAIYPSATRF